MSNDILVEDFFKSGRDKVSDGEMLSFIALYLGGTPSTDNISEVDKSKTFVSMVHNAKGQKVPVFAVYGHPESMSRISAMSILHSLGADAEGMDIDKLLDRGYSSKEALTTFEKLYRKILDKIDKTKFPEDFKQRRQDRLKKLVVNLKGSNSYFADNPKMLDELLKVAEEVGTSRLLDAAELDADKIDVKKK